MKLKLFVVSLLITFFSSYLLSEENNLQNSIDNKIFDKKIIHIVKKGDTVSSISKKYGIKKELIIKANKLIDENYIFIGQNLKIVENLLPEESNKTEIYYHKIKKGENLTEIANKYNLTLSQLVDLNDIENQEILIVGTKLKLKEEIFPKKENPIIESNIQIVKDKIMKENRYGPLLIRSVRTNIQKRKNLIEATHVSGKRLILHINCDKKEINVRGIGRKWKGWMPAKESFETKLLNDYCNDFD
tara:strand:- start:199 stop:933 length:735 start_codon:yes stop_codon:yes gene_type:complete